MYFDRVSSIIIQLAIRLFYLLASIIIITPEFYYVFTFRNIIFFEYSLRADKYSNNLNLINLNLLGLNLGNLNLIGLNLINLNLIKI